MTNLEKLKDIISRTHLTHAGLANLLIPPPEPISQDTFRKMLYGDGKPAVEDWMIEQLNEKLGG